MNGPDENPGFQSRRATLEDLPELRGLWHGARLPEENLEKRFTEFQVATSPEGNIVGAVGLQIHKQNGFIHSEAYTDPNIGVQIRPLLWQRVFAVAKNNGLHRLWTLPTASFYREQGFVDTDPNLRAKVPEVFGNPGADWITLKLRDDSPAAISAEQEFEVFAMAQRQESERRISQAKAFRAIAYGLLFLALLGVAALAYVYSRVKRKR
jgi:N-acetylglutamate synthase-like GNAT family acetyltransferase